GLKFVDDERIHLHHIDGNHSNQREDNLMAVHRSCHQQIHWSQKDI
ncbi:MAG: HNH endonuclease, partial [Moorea sp. SIO2I5]|nr:HNH endonuclease [Moorena sp. SIO2I5]NEQ88319.1 HNH endonuclease [Moorena sp. SIO2I5]